MRLGSHVLNAVSSRPHRLSVRSTVRLPWSRRTAQAAAAAETAAINFVVGLNDFVEDSLVAFNKAQKLWKSAAGEPVKSGRSHR